MSFVAYSKKRSWFERWDGENYTGEHCSEKINRVREKMENGGKSPETLVIPGNRETYKK